MSRNPVALWARRIAIALGVLIFAIPIAWVLLYRVLPVPGTALMAERALQGESLKRRPVPLERISPHLVRAVIASEDSGFCAHDGFDVEAIRRALEFNRRQNGERLRGGSTISQQTAKNLFLWPDRSWVRKGLETWFTVLIEALWPKRRIMETYLNAVEWGDGRFGAEAAAREIFGVSAAELTPRQAARLAAVLPSPNKWSAGNPGPYVRRRAAAIEQRARVVRRDRLDACVFGEKGPAAPEAADPSPAPRRERAPPAEQAPEPPPAPLELEPLPPPPEEELPQLEELALPEPPEVETPNEETPP